MARQKITEPVENSGEIEANALPELTAQQAKFVEGILSGKGVAESYRAAYDCSGMSDASVRQCASRLRHDLKIASTIGAAREACLGPAKISLEEHLRELERIRELAIQSGNLGAAAQCEQLRGKAMGHYVEKLEVKSPDPMATLRELAQHNPALAQQLADKHGVSLQ